MAGKRQHWRRLRATVGIAAGLSMAMAVTSTAAPAAAAPFHRPSVGRFLAGIP
jgi:hypothetical protein